MKTRTLMIPLMLLILPACGLNDPTSARGFRLPDGDANAGRAAFADLRCNACHRVEGIEAPAEGAGPVLVTLGGETNRVKSYGELVTSIINPSHRIAPGHDPNAVAPGGKSLMESARLNDVMTVRQLIDLVAFLQATYRVVPPEHYPYSYVYP
jgi:mono/diheme cytochrome c family protein